MKFRLFVLGALLVAVAVADPLTITVSGIGTGKLGNITFNNAAFTFTLTTDTARRLKPPCCDTTDTQNPTPTTFSITGVGSGTLTDNQAIFVSPSQSVVGLAHFNDGDLIDLRDPAFGRYDMSTSLGPITGVPSFIGACPGPDCTSFFTSAGALSFADVAKVTFNFVVSAPRVPSTTTLQTSPNPSVFGQKVTLTAALSPATAGGFVTFYDGVSVLGVGTLAGGKAAMTTSLLASGGRQLRAFYSGDATYQASTSAVLSQTVSALAQSGFQAPVTYGGVAHPRTVTVADFNGDGRPDIAVTNFDLNTVSVLLGNGNGTFQTAVSYPTQLNPSGIVAADFNGDGRTDIAVSNSAASSSSVSVLLGNGDGTFQTAVNYTVGSGPSRLVVADFNGDGTADIATSNFTDNNVSVLLGSGNGTFRTAVNSPAGAGPGEMVVGDFNGDGRPDLAAVNLVKNAVVLLGNGDGSFQAPVNYAAGASPVSVAVADFNGDGRADLAVANGGDDTVSVMLGNSNGTFQPAVNYSAPKNLQAVAVGDFNGDGRTDLVIADVGSNNVSVLLGKGDGTFQAAVTYPAGSQPIFVAVGDFDGDGRADLAVANFVASNLSVLLGVGVTAPPTISTASPLPAGTVGVAFSQTLAATGGRPPYTWSLASGTLPAGLTLSASGTIAGTPAAPGTSNFTLQVTDSVSAIGTQVFSLTIAPASQAPAISRVVNGASFEDAGLAPGLIFTIGGARLGPDVGVLAQLDANGRISTTVSEVQVLVDGVGAPLLFVRQDQINAIAPYALANKVGQPVRVQVIYKGNAGNILNVSVAATAPAIFPLGNGQGAIRNQDESVNGADNPAVRGSTVSIYATGEGQTTPPGVDGQLVTSSDTHPAAAISVTIGGVPAIVQFQGSTVFDGFLQVNAVVPDTVAPGKVSVQLSVGGKLSPQGITLAVR